MSITINHCLTSSFFGPFTSPSVEFVCVKVKLHTYILVAFYITVCLQHLSLVKNITYRLTPSDKLIVPSEFNLANVSGIFNNDLGCYVLFSYPLIYKEFFDIVHGLDHFRLNNIFNVNNKLLDLAFCWDTNVSLSRNDPFASSEDSRHPSLFLAANCVSDNGLCNHVINSD